MASISSSNPLAFALDRRIRAVVEETVEKIVRDQVSTVIRAELAAALGTGGKVTGARGRGGRRRVDASGRACMVSGCTRPYRSQGYCAAHYQAARKYKWPMPATETFTPPARPARGRPPKKAASRGRKGNKKK